METKTLVVNGIPRQVLVDSDTLLVDVLRNQLQITSVKVGCGQGQCGACSVILDGKVTRACIVKMRRVPDQAQITTLEGVGTPAKLHPLQESWMFHGAAQCGFCTPGFIVSAKALLDSNPAPSREEVRDWFQKHHNICRCTGYKPLVDAVMDAAAVMRGDKDIEELRYKLPADGRAFGSRLPRPSALVKVTGLAEYGADAAVHMPPDTLHLALAQAKVSHAIIKGIDTSEAEKMPGVVRVLTHKDVKGKNRITGLITFADNKGDGWDRPILNDTKVFQYGDALAIVCADSEAHARAAADKVKFDLELLPEYMSAPEAMAPDAIEIHPGTPNIYYEPHIEKGEDTKPFFDDPENVVVEDSFYTQRQPHLNIEPDVGYGYLNEQGQLVIHSKSIGLHLHALMIAPGLGVKFPEELVMVQNTTGGTFGYKFSPTNEAILGAAAKIIGKPVSLVFNQFQNITYTGKRSPGFMNIKLAADENGKLLGLWGNNYIDHGPYSEFGDLLTHRLSQFVGAGYDIPTIRNKSQTVFTNHAWGSAFRAYGSPQSFMGSEIAIDVLAAKMGMDPFDIRELNCYKESEKSTIPTGYAPDVYCLEEMYKMARPLYEAGKARVAEKNAASDGRYKYGIGVASGVYGCGLDGVDASQAYAELNPDGTVTMYASWEDHGQGADMGVLMSAHETLRQAGIKPEQIKLVMNDTKYTPNSGPAGGSRSQVMSGNACRLAAENLVAAMKKEDGTYRTYDEMKAEGIETKVLGNWVCDYCATHPVDQATSQGEPFATYMYTLFLPEVCVDTQTGKVTVEKFTCVADVGTIMNKLLVDGNFYGGLAQGIGLALTEDFDDLTKHTSLKGCGIPYPKDIPDDIELHYLETPRPNGPYGAAGCGEAPLDAPHPAILNAIYNATGARITRIPALPEVVLAALKEL